MEPLVSICCISYNHENYIRECLDGFLMQQTSFDYEILIHDDASTDKTAEIIKEYQHKFPYLIKPIFQTENQYSKGQRGMNAKFNFFRSKGKFIAQCEGDDYWTDPLKLQKQVDFLERNPDYGICFHTVKVDNRYDSTEYILPDIQDDYILNMEDYILNNKTATGSMVFKKEDLGTFPDWFFKLPFGDLALTLIILKNTNMKTMVIKDTMGVYRIHSEGVNGKFLENDNTIVQAYYRHLLFLQMVEKNLFQYTYKKAFLKSYIYIYRHLLRLHKINGHKFLYIKSKMLLYYHLLKLKLHNNMHSLKQ